MSPPDPATPVSAELVARNLDVVRARIADAGGDPASIRVIAVTKGFSADAVRAALDVGLGDIGENYAQELRAKAAELAGHSPGPHWHFLGHLQRNKIAGIAPIVDLYQSLGRAEEGAAIARQRPGAAVLCEVETTGLAGRNGCPPAEVPALVEALVAAGLEVRGFMTVAPPDPDGARRAFATVAELADALGLKERSMGMTEDLELAVRAGATMLRIGRGLFGARPPRRTGAGG